MHPRDRIGAAAIFVLIATGLFSSCGPNLQDILQQAETSWRKGRYSEAILANEELYKREPKGHYAARALLSIANIYYFNARKIKDAVDFYNKLNREFPDSAEALESHRHLAEIYENEIIDMDQAISQLTIVLEADDLKDRPEILYRRADLFLKKQDYDRALRELRGLEDSGIQGRLADQVQLKIGSIFQIQKKYDLAMEPFTNASASQFPEIRRRALLSLADTYENALEIDNAIATIKKLPRTLEDESFITSEIARLTKKRKDLDKAPVLIGITQPLPAAKAPGKKK